MQLLPPPDDAFVEGGYTRSVIACCSASGTPGNDRPRRASDAPPGRRGSEEALEDGARDRSPPLLAAVLTPPTSDGEYCMAARREV